MAQSFQPDDNSTFDLQGNARSVEKSTGQTGETKKAAGGMLGPFKVRNFNLLFGGQTVSTIGDAFYTVALPWLVLTNRGTPQELGIVLTVYGLPRVACVLLGGWLSDRVRPRRLMLSADAVRALLLALFALLAFRGRPTLWQLCAVAAPLGIFEGLFLPASMSILPEILKNDDLQAGNALNFTSMYGATLIGSAAAGLIVTAFSPGTAFAFDALTFAVSAVSLALMRVTGTQEQRKAAEKNETGTAGTQISFGRYLLTSRIIQMAFIILLAINFSLGGLMDVALPTLVHGPMHGTASGYGAIMAAYGAGALAGGILTGMLDRLTHKMRTALLAILITAAALALLPYGGLAGAIVCMLIGGLAGSVTNILLMTTAQLIVPHHLMGRMMGLFLFASFGLYPVSVALGGVLTHQFGPVILFPFSGLLIALAVLLGLAQKEVRDLEVKNS